MPRVEEALRVLAEEWRRRQGVLKNARAYVRAIKEFCISNIDPECRVILFGSVARGDYRPDSDVDVLVITRRVKPGDPEDRARVSEAIYGFLGFRSPIELHVVTPEEYEGWYRHFIDVYEEF